MFAYFLVSFPVFVSLFQITIPITTIVFGIFFSLFLVFKIPQLVLQKNKKQQLLKFIKNPLIILALSLFLFIIISTLVNGFNYNTLLYICYYLIFICVYSVKKESLKPLVNTLLIIMAISSIMGFIDPFGKFMPGFASTEYPLSTHFYNPNHSAYVIGTLLILTMCLLYHAKTKKENIFYGIIFAIYSFFMFLNGSFGPVSAVFLVGVIIVVYLWVVNKKFPLKMAIIYLSFVPFAFLVELYPNVQAVRTCDYNYFLELIAVYDNIFNTDLLSIFNIDKIIGADGWDRNELLLASWNSIKDAPLGFILGHGAGYFYETRPHNIYLATWLDFGLVSLLIFTSLCVILFVKFLKLKKEGKTVYHFPLATLGFLIMGFFGSTISYSFVYFIFVLALSYKLVLEKHKETKIINNKQIEISPIT